MRIHEISIKDKNYPERIRQVVQPPKKIFIVGSLLPKDETAIAIVGSRKCTAYGKQVAYDLAFALAKAGVTIVSGMALGIDGEAHKGALDAQGRTIAVLGTGVNDTSIYPRAHLELAHRIMKQGAVLSEFSSEDPSYPSNFPQRNRIIAALALGTIVVEADEKSGSLITAGFALELGKEVFAVPGPIYSRTSSGTNRLIQQGATLITGVDDVLRELGLAPQAAGGAMDALSAEEQKIIIAIEEGLADTDSLIEQLGMPAHSVLPLLSMLELKKKIQQIGHNTYAIKK